MRDLPPLRALRAFEACYRLRSFTRAAQSLNVGQPAISHQIGLLERDLGVELFKKQGSTMQATDHADSLYSVIAPAFLSIAETARSMRRLAFADEVTLATYPGVAAYWASPRLARLRHEKLGIQVRIVTSERDRDIALDEVECAILFGTGSWPGAEAELLMQEEVLPIASPALAAELGDVTPAALLQHGPLIHLEDRERRWFSWEDWRGRFAPEQTEIDRAVTVTNHGLALHQAMTGQGVPLAWTGVIASLLEGGSLVALYDMPLTSERGYWLVARPGFLKSKRGKALHTALATPS